MDFKTQFHKLSLIGETKLKLLIYMALLGKEINGFGKSISELISFLSLSEKEIYKILGELSDDGWIDRSYYVYRIKSEMRISVIAYVFSRRPELIVQLKPILKGVPGAMGIYYLVGYAFCDGLMPPSGTQLPDEALSMMQNISLVEKDSVRFASFFDTDTVIDLMIGTINDHHILGKRLESEVFDMWREETAFRHPYIKSVIDNLQAYHAYVQDGTYDTALDKGGKIDSILLIIKSMRACNLGQYEECLEFAKIGAKYFDDQSSCQDVPPLFFAAYYVAAACLHLNNAKAKRIAKRLTTGAGVNNPAYSIASILGHIALDPGTQADAEMVRVRIGATYNGLSAKSIVYLAQMIGRHFEVPSLPFVTGESDYAIIRHEVTPIDEQSAELIDAYGSIPAVLSVPYKQKWERLIDAISETLTSHDSPAEKQTRRIFVLNESTNEVAPMEQSWLKSQRWSKPKPLARSSYSLQGLNNPDRYDEIFASACTSQYYWPQASTVLPMLKGCDRLYVTNLRRGNDITELEMTEETPYLSIDKKGDGFTVSSNLSPSDLSEPAVVKKTKKAGTYTYIPISEKIRTVLRPLLCDIRTFPAAAEDKLRSMLALVDEVLEVRSNLLDRKSLTLYQGRPMIAARLQPATGGLYEATFCSQPLPDSTKTPPPGKGRKELIDTIGGEQVRVVRDLEGESGAYESLCDALENVEGADLYEDENRATLSVGAVLELMAWAQAHTDSIVIDWMQGKEMRLKQAAGSSWNVGLKSNNGWFDIEGEVRIDDETVISMAQLLDMVAQNRGRYLRLDDNLFIAIDKKLRRQLERIEALSVKNHNKLQISKFNAAMLDDVALDGDFKVQFDQKLTDLQKNIKKCNDIVPQVPATLNAELRPYQVEGFQWMSRLASWGAGACLADDMGLGKTVQTIAFLLSKAAEGPALVLAPASVVPNWEAEIARVASSLRSIVLNKAEDRTLTSDTAKDYDGILSTYGLLNTEEAALVEKKWSTICLDEAHTIKNRETKMSHVAMQLQADYRIILTGTPIQNHLGEIWNLFRFINPGLLGGFDTFRHKFVKPITEDNDKARRKALQGILRPFMLRRTKAEVIDDLPEKNEIIIPVELSDAELTRYEAMRKKAAQELENAEKVDINTLAEITRLRRAACSMRLVDQSWTGEDAKVQAFLDIVSEFKGSGVNRMLVFSQFTSYLDIVRQALDKAGEKYLYLDGSTTMKQREQLVAQFRNGDTPLFLISLKAGGLGLNLPEANYVMHLDPWWNPAIEQQATDRAYRIGQKRDVTVYHLVAKNTIEEKILRLHRTKRDLADSLLEGTDMAGKLTIKDILELISNA